MSQCLGRYVKDWPKGVNMPPFEDGMGRFYIPFRCEAITTSGDLCDDCLAKEAKTAERMKDISGIMVDRHQQPYLMGRVTEPIPYWCRLYDGAWFRLKMESGCRVSEENMARVRKAVAQAYEGVTPVEPTPIPAKVKKALAEPKVAEPKVAEPKVASVEPKAAPAIPKRRANVKKPPSTEPLARVEGPVVDTSEDTVVHVKVRKQEVDGRLFYLDPKKDKLYDMKFKYVGRLKDGAIVNHPDSDAEN